jgi:hypothetical protein
MHICDTKLVIEFSSSVASIYDVGFVDVIFMVFPYSSCSGPSNAWDPGPKQFSLKLKYLFSFDNVLASKIFLHILTLLLL